MLTRIKRVVRILKDSPRFAGTLTTVQWYGLRLWQKVDTVVRMASLRPRYVCHPLKVYLGATSDMMLFKQIFVSEEYRCLRDLRDVRFILDLGANVGFSSAYFLSIFPMCRIVSVEPDRRNVVVCEQNLAPYGERTLLLHGAAWRERTRLCLSEAVFGDGLDWSRQVRESNGSDTPDVEAWDLGTLIEMGGMERVDLLKVDIEGSEIVVFGSNPGRWLNRVRNICIELHGDECKRVFFTALAGFDYDLECIGEITICRNIRPKSVFLTN